MSSLIERHEGFRDRAYLCPRGIWTIGFGNTTWPDGRPVKKGDTITREKALAMMRDYIIKNVDPVFDKIPYTLTEDQRDAIRSLVYNWNAKGFLASKLFKAICTKDWTNICREWDFGFVNNLPGLFKRRTEELYMFVKDLK